MLLWLLLWNPLIALWCAWTVQAVVVVFQARKFSRRAGWPVREGFDAYHPPAAVVVPCKGSDPELRRNVRGLLNQHYPEYRLVFVFESDHDPARVLIEDELAQHPDPAPAIDLITAGLAPDDTGQKVHNQLAALAFLDAAADASEAWVFADSDAVPGPGWLQKLVGPLVQQDRVGVTTGYRWLMPELRAQRPRTASMFASVINSAVAMFIGHGELTQAWGGSMAVRADFARRHGLTDYLRGALSDDYQMTRMCRDAGKRVYFVHRCLVASPVHLTWPELFEFGRRQYLITRIHDPSLYRRAVAVIGFYVAGALTAWAALVFAAATGRYAVAVCAAAALLIVAAANQARASYRRRAVVEAFGREQPRYLRHTLRLDRFGTTAVMLVNLALLLSAARGNVLVWRGHRYRLDGPRDIQRLPS
ncbi:MAG: glycosyltransferase family 2 protein [Planctomycetota bacterium]